MLWCQLSREQLQEALKALDIAHSNGWVASKAIFSMTSYNDRNAIWDLDRCSFTGKPNIIVDGGAKDGSNNFGSSSYMYEEETLAGVLERNREYEEERNKRNSEPKHNNDEWDEEY